jgi:sugar phosphate isomerase/epimerase
MRDLSENHRWLSINTATVRKAHGQDVPLAAIFDACARKGIRAVSPWRDQVAAMGLKQAALAIQSLGLELSGYCRGGLYPAVDAAGLQAHIDDNKRAVDEACTLGAPCLVIMAGGLPGALVGGKAQHPQSKDMPRARAQAAEGMAATLAYAKSCGLPLAIEPLHPMFAADRCNINTLEQALDLCDQLDPAHSGAIGIAVDCYHVWWDPKLEQQIARIGPKRLLAFHVCDWMVPTTDMLNDRGMMGDGVIEIPSIREMVEAQGFAGYCEAEIFSTAWWNRSTQEILDACIARVKTAV